MSLVTSRNSNKSQSPSRVLQRRKAQAGTSSVVSCIRRAVATPVRLFVQFVDMLAEVRMQRALVEVELYRSRYRHSSKNDDDLPIIRPVDKTAAR